jgi:hypothetical protein
LKVSAVALGTLSWLPECPEKEVAPHCLGVFDKADKDIEEGDKVGQEPANSGVQ